MKMERSSGVLIHISSLPGPYGIGDMGPAAYDFLKILEASGHRFWQLLPLNPTDKVYNHSPYSTFSAFAGNPLLISPDVLAREGYIDAKDLPVQKGFKSEKVVFKKVEKFKEEVLDIAWKNSKKNKLKTPEYLKFSEQHEHWLDDYSLYLALRKKYNEGDWTKWPRPVKMRNPDALLKIKKELSEEIKKAKFIQFLFFSQWKQLVKEARKRNIKFFGDVPFYINHDSVDCWVNPHLFKLDAEGNPTHVSGVPPDLFSDTGQLWGTPVYNWKELKKAEYQWWISRLKQNLLLFDVVRLDHFRAFSAYWEVPASNKTAKNGKWIKTPGTEFFKKLKKEVPDMPFIAEDLGSLDQPVYDLIKRFNFPRMKVLQFAFGNDYRENPYLPFNHLPNDVVYTGTHDNNTTIGWYKKTEKKEKQHLKEISGKQVTGNNVHRVLHRLALQSVANLAIVPVQDLVGLGEEAIMNIPGSTEGNWSWRITQEQIPGQKIVKELRELNKVFGRFVETEVKKRL